MRLLTGDARREIVNGHKKPLFSGRYVTFGANGHKRPLFSGRHTFFGVNGHKKPLFSGRLWINNDMNI